MAKRGRKHQSYERKVDQPVAITPVEYSGHQEAYDHFNGELFDGKLPDVFITYQRKARSYGHFSPNRFISDAWGRLNVWTPFHHLSGDSHLHRSLGAGPITASSTTLADFSRARDSQITFSVTHGWSAFWRGRPWLAGRRIGETSSGVGSSRFWIGWVTKHGDECARSTCRD